MATAGKQRYQCATCDRLIELPRTLDCGHVFCKRCYSRHHNEYVLKPSHITCRQEPPNYVPCNVCQLMSRVPGSGAPGGVSDILSALRLESHYPTNPDINTNSEPRVEEKSNSETTAKLITLFESKSRPAVKIRSESRDDQESHINVGSSDLLLGQVVRSGSESEVTKGSKRGPKAVVQPGSQSEVIKGSTTGSQPIISMGSPSVVTTGSMSKSGSQGVATSNTPILLWHSTKYPHIHGRIQGGWSRRTPPLSEVNHQLEWYLNE